MCQSQTLILVWSHSSPLLCDCMLDLWLSLHSVLHWCSYSSHLKGVLPLQVHLQATSLITATAFSQTVCLFILEGAKWAPYILLCCFAPRDVGHIEKPPPTSLLYCLDIQKSSALPAFSIFFSLRVHVSDFHLSISFFFFYFFMSLFALLAHLSFHVLSVSFSIPHFFTSTLAVLLLLLRWSHHTFVKLSLCPPLSRCVCDSMYDSHFLS